MFNDLPNLHRNEALELRAFNAAFYELGFRWYWDEVTHQALLAYSPDPVERILHYIQSEHAHLLKAYDAAFLLRVIVEKQAVCRRQAEMVTGLDSRPVDWSQMVGQEIGA
jgi:hypothetical protein